MGNITISTDDRVHLAEIVAGLYQFSEGGPRGRYQILDAAGLGKLAAVIDLEGSTRMVVLDLIDRISMYGDVDERTTALGAFLREVLSMGDLPQADAGFIAEVIVKYSLIRDQEYLREMKRRYNSTSEESHYKSPSSLSGSQMKQLQQALLSAFSRGDLRHLVYYTLDENFEDIVGEGNLASQVFELVTWANQQNRWQELVAGARRQNPGNAVLKAFAGQFETGARGI